MLHFLAELWHNWLTLFGVFPYGDPYLAFGALFVLYFPVRRLISRVF